ncbi:MAG: hypothetical protein H7145_07015 [Akkermansiaceae bacterium]|nr:hypothetical protein [Armatimonadota bacterium]
MPQSFSLPTDALAFALCAAGAFAALDLSQKWTARYAVSSPEPFLALRFLGGAVLSPLLLLLPGTTAPRFDANAAVLLVTLVFVNLLGNVLYLRSVYRADISVVGSLWPLKNFYLPFLAYVPFLGFATTQERFPPQVYAWLAVATLGALGIAYNKKLRWQALGERPVALMAGVIVPVFAVSDLLFGAATVSLGARWTTVFVSWGIAAVGLPFLLRQRENRVELRSALSHWRGRLGATLTGVFLVIGVYCIGEAFKRSQGVVLVNVFAMLSGLFLLAVNAALPGRLDGDEGRLTYAVRFAGALLLVGAASALLYAGK